MACEGDARSVRQAREARQAIEKHQPARILTLGGDSLVDLAPIAYLNKRHGGKLGVPGSTPALTS